MVLTAVILLHLLLTPSVRGVPVDIILSQATTTEVIIVTQIVTSEVQAVETSPILVYPSANVGIPLVPSSLMVFPTTTTTELETVTSTITPSPVLATLYAIPSTVVDTITVKTVWNAPPQMTDLSCFNVTEFAYGQHNMQIVNGIPADASATTPTTLAVATAALESVDGTLAPSILSPAWDNSSAAIQLFYPAGSINPGADIQGGADFYAQPLDLSDASNVTFEYSVFFPVNFDWALAGKLPGLYGGHETCSGGDDALECFSTRLMWREGGAGELYLYAPKDKQTEALCSTPPISVCDAEYGLSVGRGAFNFTPGAWTHVKQTVTLNTPGEQDGGFVLNVDGQEVMNRMDVFYRDAPPPSPPFSPSPPSALPTTTLIPPAPGPTQAPAPPAAQPGGLGGIIGILPLGPLGPLIGGVAGQLFRTEPRLDFAATSVDRVEGDSPTESQPNVVPRQEPALSDEIVQTADGDEATTSTVVTTATTYTFVTVDPMIETTTLETTTTVTRTVVATATPILTADSLFGEESAATGRKPVTFTGLFFSSFFGGHKDKYASPQDQYTWFKDFSIAVNE